MNAEILLEHFEDMSVLNCSNESVLRFAADLAPFRIIEKLIGLGYDAKLIDSNGSTALIEQSHLTMLVPLQPYQKTTNLTLTPWTETIEHI